VLLYGVGSPLAIDAEESCRRSGRFVVAGVRNVEGDVHVTAAVRIVAPGALTAAERALACIVPLFTPGHRHAGVADAARHGLVRGATLVDATAVVAQSSSVGAGTWINAGAIVGGLGALSEWVLVNRGASLGHHAQVEAFASIGPGAVLAGLVHVGRGAMVGAGALVCPRSGSGAMSWAPPAASCRRTCRIACRSKVTPRAWSARWPDTAASRSDAPRRHHRSGASPRIADRPLCRGLQGHRTQPVDERDVLPQADALRGRRRFGEREGSGRVRPAWTPAT